MAFNISIAAWAILWFGGAFYFLSLHDRWVSMFLANWIAIALPALFLGFVKSYLGYPLKRDRSFFGATAFSTVLAVVSLIFPRNFIPSLQQIGQTYIPNAGILLWIFATQYTVLIVYGAWLLIRDLPKQTMGGRNKTNHILIGCLIGFAGGFTTFPPSLGLSKQYPFGVLFIPIYCLVISYAILKHRLMDITLIIRKTLVYSVVTSVLAIIYLGTVGLFANLFEGFSGVRTFFSSAIAAGLITFFFQPLRKRVQHIVDTKFFRQYVDREEKLYELSREVITHTTPDAMGNALRQVLMETFHPKAGALYVRSKDGSGFSAIASWGDLKPAMLGEENPMVRYFFDHPLPFLLDLSHGHGSSQNTRSHDARGRGL